MTKAIVLALIVPMLATPAFATNGPVSAKSSVAGPLILARNKADKDTASEGKQAVCAKPAIKQAPEIRTNRSSNCPKPRPILM